MSVCIVIPARLGSTRLPEKALADIHGKTMIEHVYQRAKRVKNVDEVLVATDHLKIMDAVKAFGGKAVMTPASLNSGTDRVAFVAQERSEKIFVNIQGDEPMLDPLSVEKSIELVQSGKFSMATPAARLKDKESLENRNVVKVLVNTQSQAVYFSRFAIPYSRGIAPQNYFPALHHMGVYVYTRETLLRFSKLTPCAWESGESLEQLRALYYGIPIGVAEVSEPTPGVDTHEDLELVRRKMIG